MFGAVSCVDHGDAPTVPGYIEDTLARIAEYVEADPPRRRDPARHRRRPLGHARRAARRGRGARPARARAPRLAPRRLGLLLRPAAKPRHGLPARLRGGAARPVPLPAGRHARRRSTRPDDYAAPRELGIEILPWTQLARSQPGGFGERARAGSAAARRSSPSTSTSSTRPSARRRARPRSADRPAPQALELVRALTGSTSAVRRGRGRPRRTTGRGR